MRSFLATAVSLLCITSMAYCQTTPPIVYPPGSYTVNVPTQATIATTVKDGKVVVTFTWTDPSTPVPTPEPKPEPPKPVPPPEPDPEPAPVHIPKVVGQMYVIQLTDAETPLTPEQQARIDNSSAIKRLLKPYKAYWYAWNTKSPEASTWLNAPEIKQAGGYPVLILATRNGAGIGVVSYCIQLPGPDDDIVNVVQQARK